jgi:16S rRNA processing protein RimM
MSDLVLLGRISGAHGLKGEVKIAAFTAHPEDVAAYGPLSSGDGARTFEVTSLRTLGNGAVIVRLRGVADRNAAEALRGTELFVPRSKLPSPEEDEFYHSDLIGLDAVSSSGEIIGEVIAVYNFGAGDLLEVRFVDERQPVLIPFEDAHVPDVDIAGRRVTIVRPVFEQQGGAETS